jgi:hypothetical protein
MSQSDQPAQKHRPGGPAALPAVCTQSNGAEEPAFLDADYVCTELPTHMTVLNTREIEERRKRDLAVANQTSERVREHLGSGREERDPSRTRSATGAVFPRLS